MVSKDDMAKLEAAQQAVDKALKSLLELYKSATPLLAEHAFDMMEPVGKINQRLQRLLAIAQEKP